MTQKFRKGDRVTGQSTHWYDGTPVHNWPDPQFLGTIVEIVNLAGVLCAWIKFDTGRRDLESLDRLHLVPKARGGA